MILDNLNLVELNALEIVTTDGGCAPPMSAPALAWRWMCHEFIDGFNAGSGC
jgi:hypothetical protein